MFEKQFDKRLVFYRKNNYDINLYKLDGSKEKIEKKKRRNISKKKIIDEYLFDD